MKRLLFALLLCFTVFADETIFHSLVEDATVDVYGNLYVLKQGEGKEKNKLLASRYLKSGALDPSFGNGGHLLINLNLSPGSQIGNAKLAICPKTGDLLLAMGRTRQPESQPLGLNSGENQVREIFQRVGSIGDNRTLMMRFSPEGKRRNDFGKNGLSSFRFSSDNSDRLYSFGVAEDGRLLLSWRMAGQSRVFVRNADGKPAGNRLFENGDLDIFTSNIRSSPKGQFQGAGITVDSEIEPEIYKPVLFKGKSFQVIDRLYPEVEGNRGIQSALLVNGKRSTEMMVVVPDEESDRIEQLELKTGDGNVQQEVKVAGKLVSEILRPTQLGAVLVLSTKEGTAALIATEIDPKTGKPIRTRQVGTVHADSGGFIPKCMDVLTHL